MFLGEVYIFVIKVLAELSPRCVAAQVGVTMKTHDFFARFNDSQLSVRGKSGY
jgi:hypothetical protein